MQSLTDDDLRLLRAAIGLSRRARQSGNEPYGAVLGDAHGRVLLEAQNTQVTERDCTGHAETNLMRAASHRFEPTELAECTVYASGEPCPMCAGAIYWGGVRRVVYALSMRSMAQLAGAGVDEINLGVRKFSHTGRRR